MSTTSITPKILEDLKSRIQLAEKRLIALGKDPTAWKDMIVISNPPLIGFGYCKRKIVKKLGRAEPGYYIKNPELIDLLKKGNFDEVERRNNRAAIAEWSKNKKWINATFAWQWAEYAAIAAYIINEVNAGRSEALILLHRMGEKFMRIDLPNAMKRHQKRLGSLNKDSRDDFTLLIEWISSNYACTTFKDFLSALEDSQKLALFKEKNPKVLIDHLAVDRLLDTITFFDGKDKQIRKFETIRRSPYRRAAARRQDPYRPV